MKNGHAMFTLLLTLVMGALLTGGAWAATPAHHKAKAACPQAPSKDFSGSYQVKPNDFDLSNASSRIYKPVVSQKVMKGEAAKPQAAEKATMKKEMPAKKTATPAVKAKSAVKPVAAPAAPQAKK